jgi:hypothetical protein
MGIHEIISRWNWTIVKLIPPTYRKKFADVGYYAGKEDVWYQWVGGLFTLGAVLFIVGVILANTIAVTQWEKIIYLLIGVASPFVALMIGYILLYFIADKRTTFVEHILPDALQMIAANLRAGVTPYQAVKSAAIPDFGPLGKEFERVTNAAIGNVSFREVLLSVQDHFNSPALTRSIKLFASSIKSGGHLADLLEGLAVDLTERQALKKELVTNTTTNTMFIMFTIIIGTPLLLAISIYFVDVVTGLQGSAAGGSTSGGFGLGAIGGEISITSDFLIKVSYGMLLVTGLLACLFIGSMIDGEAKKGLKWAPVVIGASYGMFLIARFVVTYMLGNTL